MKYPSWLTRIPGFDKYLHAIGCLSLYGLGRLVISDPITVMLLVGVIAWAKEYIYDAARQDRHTVDVWDFFAGIIPVAAVCMWEVTR